MHSNNANNNGEPTFSLNDPPSQLTSEQTDKNLNGIERLKNLDFLFIKQKFGLMELFFDRETKKNRYIIQNSQRNSEFYGIEKTKFCESCCCCGNEYQLKFSVYDSSNNNEVMRVLRKSSYQPCGPCCACCDCCLEKIEIQTPLGETIGHLKQVFKQCSIEFHIQDVNDVTVLKIVGLSLFGITCKCCSSIVFQILTKNDDVIGSITKDFSNLCDQWFTDADIFEVKFPKDLDINMKAVILGAVFLIDVMFFESPSKDDKPGEGEEGGETRPTNR